MSKCNFFFPWTGRKKRYENEIVFKNINLKNITKIVEPFGGSMSFSQYLYMYKDRKDLKYVYNDTDTNIYNFFKLIHEEGLEKLEELCNVSNKFKATQKNKKDIGNEIPIQQFFINKAHGIDSKFMKNDIKKPVNYEEHVKFIESLHRITNKDYKEIFDKYKYCEDVLIYLDPPYFSSFNGEYMSQKNEASDLTKILVDIVEMFENAKCHLVYVHNKNALMDHIFKNSDCETKEYEKIYQYTRKKVVHSIRIK